MKTFTLLVLVLATELAAAAAPSRQILFLCTGNFYRSRLAEAVFNYTATERKIAWRATSRALRQGPLKADQQVQRLSPFTRAKLKEMGIALSFTGAEPVKASRADLDHADCIIALSEREHRPLLEAGSALRISTR